MSRETERFFKAFYQHIEGKDLTEEEYQSALDEFLEQHNRNLPHAPKPAGMTADDYLDQAYDAESEEEAIKYAKKALKLDKNCLDAKCLIIEASHDIEKAKIDLEKAIAIEKKRLENDELFEAENIGSFYGILETRPYMRACASYVELLIIMGKIKKAIAECERLIELSAGDNMGIRYKLMGLYAAQSDAEGAEALHKKYKEESFMLLYPRALLYYKLDNLKKAKPLIKKLAQVNAAYVDFVTGKINLGEDEIVEIGYQGMYAPGTIEEVITYFSENPYLVMSAGAFNEWVAQECFKFL